MALGKIRENVRGLTLAAGLALGGIAGATAASAESANNVLAGTTFPSYSAAFTAIKNSGGIPAKAFDGTVLSVDADFAKLLIEQGFEERNGVLYGYDGLNFFEALGRILEGTYSGLNFAPSEYVETHGVEVEVKALERRPAVDPDDGGDTGGCSGITGPDGGCIN